MAVHLFVCPRVIVCGTKASDNCAIIRKHIGSSPQSYIPAVGLIGLLDNDGNANDKDDYCAQSDYEPLYI